MAEQRQLGAGGPVVAPLALGTMTFGAETDEHDAHQQLDLFVERGGNLIDTADVYAGGESERDHRSLVGRTALERWPDRCLQGPVRSAGGFARGVSTRAVRAVDDSLDRLGVECLDMFSVHGWDPYTPVEETLDTLSTLVRQGKIHHLGWSNTTGWQVAAHHDDRPVGWFCRAGRLPTAVQTCSIATSSGRCCRAASRKVSASTRGHRSEAAG